MKSYLITGVNTNFDFLSKNLFTRSIVKNTKSKLEAMKVFYKTYPEMEIISICELNKYEIEWLIKYNMSNVKYILQ